MSQFKYFACLVLIFIIFVSCNPTQTQENVTASSNDKKEAPNNSLELLVGTFTNENSKGIYKVIFDKNAGTLSNPILLAEKHNPGFLHLSADRNLVYSSNADTEGSISVWQFNETRDKLSLISEASSKGDGACYVTTNDSETMVAAANYSSGSIVHYTLDAKGLITDDADFKQHTGDGPHPNQNAAHAHCVKYSKDGKFLYAVDLGTDEVIAYVINDSGRLAEGNIAIKMEEGDGPRHMIFHHNKAMVFVINELSSTVVSAEVDPITGKFTPIDKQSTIPSDFEDYNNCADIHLSNDGKYLYASNRGHNSIAVFSVDDKGKLALLANTSVEGDWPRNFTFSPDGEFMLVANKKTNNITVFDVDKATGLLTYTNNQIAVPTPVCLKF